MRHFQLPSVSRCRVVQRERGMLILEGKKRVFILNNHVDRRYGKKNERQCLVENFPAPSIPCERLMYGTVGKLLTTCFSAEKKEIY